MQWAAARAQDSSLPLPGLHRPVLVRWRQPDSAAPAGSEAREPATGCESESTMAKTGHGCYDDIVIDRRRAGSAGTSDRYDISSVHGRAGNAQLLDLPAADAAGRQAVCGVQVGFETRTAGDRVATRPSAAPGARARRRIRAAREGTQVDLGADEVRARGEAAIPDARRGHRRRLRGGIGARRLCRGARLEHARKSASASGTGSGCGGTRCRVRTHPPIR